ncbi:hypothetical protein Pelo_13121 [Pelomyxa schiedti]|nr:hypothetical protein Pelo_13121 [Pelomyxa schiedti]
MGDEVPKQPNEPKRARRVSSCVAGVGLTSLPAMERVALFLNPVDLVNMVRTCSIWRRAMLRPDLNCVKDLMAPSIDLVNVGVLAKAERLWQFNAGQGWFVFMLYYVYRLPKIKDTHLAEPTSFDALVITLLTELEDGSFEYTDILKSIANVMAHRLYMNQELRLLEIPPADLPIVRDIIQSVKVYSVEHNIAFIDDHGGSTMTAILSLERNSKRVLFRQFYYNNNENQERYCYFEIIEPVDYGRKYRLKFAKIAAALFSTLFDGQCPASENTQNKILRAIIWPWGRYNEGYSDHYTIIDAGGDAGAKVIPKGGDGDGDDEDEDSDHEDDDIKFHLDR